MDVFKLLGTIAINNSDANTALDETAEKGERTQSKLSSAFGKVAKAGALVAAGTAAAGAAIYGMASKAAGATDRIDKMSQKIGVSRKAFQELDFICSQSGTSVEGLQAGMKTLTAAMDGASSGTKKNVEQFKKLGVSVTNSKGELRSQEEVFFDTISALQKMDNQTEKARLATELFGRSGTELMPLLNGASGSIEQMRKQAHDLGLVLDDETIDAGVAFTDAIDQVKRALDAVVTKVGVAVMPVIMQLIDVVRDNMPLIQSIVSKVFGVLSIVVQTAIDVLSALINKGKDVVSFMADKFSPVFEALKNLFFAVKDALQPLIDKIKDYLSGSKGAEGATGFLKGAIESLAGILTNVINGITEFVKWLSSGSTGAETFKAVIVGLTAGFVAFKAIMLATTIATNAQIIALKAQALVSKGVAAAQAALNLVMSINPIGLIIIAITALVAAFIYLWNNCEGFREFWINLWDKIKEVAGQVADWFKKAWGAVVDWFSDAWQTIKDVALAVWDAIKAVWEFVKLWFKITVIDPVVILFTGLWTVLKGIWDGIVAVVKFAINLIAAIIDAAFQLITLPFHFIWENCKEYVFAAWNWIVEKVTNGINKAKQIITTVWTAVSKFFSTIWNGIKNIVGKAWDWIKTKVTTQITIVKTVITTVFNAVKSFITTIWNGIKTTVGAVWDWIKNKVTTVINAVKTVITTVFNAVKTVVSNVWNGIKTVISNVWNGIKTTVTNAVNNVKSKVSSVFNGIKTTVTNVWNGIKNAIKTPIEKARDLVKTAIDKIKGFFNFEFKWPKLKMPHFGISPKGWQIGDLLKGKIPKLSIDWYAKAMNNPIIMTRPTLFGLNGNGELMAGGEAGSEVVSGTNSLMSMIRANVKNEIGGAEQKLETLISMLAEFMPEIIDKSQKQIVLNNGVLVGELAPAMDSKLGEIDRLRGRGR